MDFKIVWTDPALDDLQKIVSYIARDNPEASRDIGEEILRHVELLGSFPWIGPPYPRGSSGSTREIVCGKYRIFYRIKESPKQVEVLTIWHGARGNAEFER